MLSNVMSWLGISKLLRFLTLNIKTSKAYTKAEIQTANMPFYAVAKGRNPGIFMTWGDCEAQVKGFSGARYKKFDSITNAQEFITNESGVGKGSVKTPMKSKQTSVTKFNNKPGHNLKRSYSTSSYDHHEAKSSQKIAVPKNKAARQTIKKNKDDYDSSFSDESDDLNTIINKQMDDIEQRLKSSEKNINKIIKESTKISNRQAIMIEPPQPKKQRSSRSHMEFEYDGDGYVTVYTDGACSANGQKGARAGLGVYWGENHFLNTSEPVSGRATNNCGEIQAASMAIRQAVQNGIKKLAINTDSQFLINSVTKWIPGWKRKGWKLSSGQPVKNEVDFKELDSLQKQIAIKWNYVEAHKGIHGNEMADQLAKAGAGRYNM